MDNVLTTFPVAIVTGILLCMCFCCVIIVFTGGKFDIRKDGVSLDAPGVKHLVLLSLRIVHLIGQNRASREGKGNKQDRTDQVDSKVEEAEDGFF